MSTFLGVSVAVWKRSVPGTCYNVSLSRVQTRLFSSSSFFFFFFFFFSATREVRPGMSDVNLLSGISGLSFGFSFLSLVEAERAAGLGRSYLLPNPAALSASSFIYLFIYLFSLLLLMVRSPDFSPENSQLFCLKEISLFCAALVEQLRDDAC